MRSVLSVVLAINRLCIRLIPPFTMSENRIRRTGIRRSCACSILQTMIPSRKTYSFRCPCSVLGIQPRAAREAGGADRDRTDDLKLAKLALSQLSYGPIQQTKRLVGPGRVERPISRLSGVRSNHLSYEPVCQKTEFEVRDQKVGACEIAKRDR